MEETIFSRDHGAECVSTLTSHHDTHGTLGNNKKVELTWKIWHGTTSIIHTSEEMLWVYFYVKQTDDFIGADSVFHEWTNTHFKLSSLNVVDIVWPI